MRHCELASTTMAMARPFKFCCVAMFLSVVIRTSNPASSAAFSNSPFTSWSHPASFAFVTVWPLRNGISGAGVPWSNRMRIDGHLSLCRNGRLRWVETTGRKLQHGNNLFPRHVKPFHNFVYGGPGFEVFEHGGHRHTGI